jgi:starch synthase
MRIALIALHFAEYSYRLAAALARNNEVLLIVERNSFERELGTTPPQKTRGLTLHYVQHSRSFLSVIGNARSIRSTVESFQPDVVHIQEVIWDYLLFALPTLKRFPIVLTIHDPAPHSGEAQLMGLRKRYNLYRWLIRRSCDAVIAHGDFLSSEVERLYPRLRGKVFSIPHGPLGKMDETPNFAWEQGALLFFGRIHAYKGLIYYIEAVERLAANGIPVKGIIAGRGTELDLYRERLASNGLFEVIEGFIPNEDVPNLFHRAQIVVLPYTDGTQSGVAALAMGYARPVIASKVGSIPELVQHEISGLLTEPRSVNDLVSAISNLVQNPVLCEKMGMNGWNRCKTELSWVTISSLTRAAYDSVSRGMDNFSEY